MDRRDDREPQIDLIVLIMVENALSAVDHFSPYMSVLEPEIELYAVRERSLYLNRQFHDGLQRSVDTRPHFDFVLRRLYMHIGCSQIQCPHEDIREDIDIIVRFGIESSSEIENIGIPFRIFLFSDHGSMPSALESPLVQKTFVDERG